MAERKRQENSFGINTPQNKTIDFAKKKAGIKVLAFFYYFT
jgi:hypothetical protein